jgi:high-affinity iron transporter
MEAAIIVSVLLSFINRMNFPGISTEKVAKLQVSLKKMVWIGTAVGLTITFALGGAIIAVWYIYGTNLWEGAEILWEAVFGLVAVIAITATALAMLKSHELQDKLLTKLSNRIHQQDSSRSTSNDQESIETLAEENTITKVGSGAKFVFFWIPFLTVLREGLEGMVFVGGVAISEPASSIPAAAISGLIGGFMVGYVVHYGGRKMTLHYFFIVSSYLLLLIAAGLLSRAEGLFEEYLWSRRVAVDPDAIESVFFDPRVNVWMLPCCKKNQSGWSVFSSILGWRDVATIGTVVIYCSYWIAISVVLVVMRRR